MSTIENVKNKWSNFCLKAFPGGFKVEFKLLGELYIPLVFTMISRSLNPIISVITCGNLSKIELDSASLANTIINIFGYFIELGFSTAFDPLYAQYYGANQKKKIGYLLQKALLLMSILYIILACIHLNIEPILILFKQIPLVAEITTTYVTYLLPGLYFDFLSITLSRYLQNQNNVIASTVVALISNIFNAILQPIFVHVLGYGIMASAIVQGCSCLLSFVLMLIYILMSKVYVDTWPGFSWKACLADWKTIFYLGISGIIFVSLPEWNFEVITFVIGSYNLTQFGAHAVALQVATIAYLFFFSLSLSTTIRTSQYLGMNDIKRLKTVIRIALISGLTIATIIMILILSFRMYIPRLFTQDKNVITVSQTVLIVIAVIGYSDIISAIPRGVIIATGDQISGTIVMSLSYYMVGLPVGFVLMFIVKMDVTGIWLGLLLGGLTQGVILWIIILRKNWKEECLKANKNTSANSYIEENSDETTLISLDASTGSSPEPIHTPEHIPLKVLCIVVSLLLFIGSLLVKIYLPKQTYLPCIVSTNFSRPLYVNHPNLLCSINSGVTTSA